MNSATRLHLILLLLVALLLPLSAQAHPTTQGHIPPPADRLPHAILANARPERLIDGRLRGQSGPLGVVIELEDAPSTLLFAHAQSTGASLQAERAAQIQLARVEQAQQRVQAPYICRSLCD
jgi:hypothetical protein